jgi:uncharacterized membrane protein
LRVLEKEPGLSEWLSRLDDAPTRRVLAAVGYIPFLCFLPLFARRDDEFARFHGKQSLILLAMLVGAWVVIWLLELILARMLGHIFLIGFLFRIIAWVVYYPIGGAVSLSYLAASVAGTLNALAGRPGRIPFVAALADQLSI